MEIITIGSIIWGVIATIFALDYKEQIEEISEVGKINVSVGEMVDVKKDIYVEIPLEGSYYMDSDNVESLKTFFDGHKALYTWKYTLHFGYNFDESWKWCLEADQDDRSITLNVPEVTEFKFNHPHINPDLISGAWSDSLLERADEYAEKRIYEKINEYRSSFLKESSGVSKSVADRYSLYLINFLNETHSGYKPISEVILKTGTCEDG